MAATHAETVTESAILTSYLLPPSPLPTLLPYSEFLKQCVPAQHRSHPHLKRLYTDLQFQRSIDIDSVRQNIEREAFTKASGLRARLAKAVAEENGVKHENHSKKRKRGGEEEDINLELKDESSDDEFTNPLALAVDRTYESADGHPSENVLPSHRSSNLDGSKTMHTGTTLLYSMDTAVSSLEREIAELEQQSSTMLAEMQETVGGLSDLRYGKFARVSEADGKTMEQGIVDALDELNEACRKARGKPN